jgi:hypothetical protein
LGDEIKDSDMGRACSMHRIYEKFIENITTPEWMRKF